MTSIVPMYQFVEVQLTDVSLWAKTLYEDKQISQQFYLAKLRARVSSDRSSREYFKTFPERCTRGRNSNGGILAQ